MDFTMATTALTQDAVATEIGADLPSGARPKRTVLMAGAPHFYLTAIIVVLVLVLVASTVIGGGTLAVASLLGGVVGGALYTLIRDRWYS